VWLVLEDSETAAVLLARRDQVLLGNEIYESRDVKSWLKNSIVNWSIYLDLRAEGFLKFGADLAHLGCDYLGVSEVQLDGDLGGRVASRM
jgi:hypothetical protein